VKILKSSLKNFSKRKIIIGSDISESEADKIITQLHLLNLSKGDIILKINSRGGSFEGSLKLYEAISFSENPVIGVVIGYAFSGAAIILQACKKRYATTNSKILFHHPKYSISKTINPKSDIEEIIKYLKEEIKIIIEKDNLIKRILLDKTRMNKDEVEIFLNQEKKLQASEAKELGIIDEVLA